ncbi:MAG TPA: hypothetical protein VF950_21565 [Planctomycetota bacterium]
MLCFISKASSLVLAALLAGPEVKLEDAAAGQPLKVSWKGFEKAGDDILGYHYRVISKEGATDVVLRDFVRVPAGKTSIVISGLRLEPNQTIAVVVAVRYASKPRTRTLLTESNRIKITAPPAEEEPEVDETPAGALLRFASGVEGLSARPADGDAPGEAVLRALENPETLNAVLKSLLAGDHGLRLLKDLKLEIKALQANEGETVLGVGWTYDKVVTSLPFDLPSTHGFDLRVESEGTAAFDREQNPKDFLKAAVGLSFFASFGGVVGEADAATQDKLNALVDVLVDIKDARELDRSEHWRAFDEIVRRYLTTQVYVDLGVDAGLEANQGFTSKQAVFEAKLGFDVKAWNDGDPLAQLNLFDWPFAVLRFMTGYDEKVSVRGSTIPVLRAAIGLVDPFEGDPRDDVGDDSSFWRYTLKAGFRTPVARVAGSTVHFEAYYRYDRELGPSREVRTAELDTYRYYTVTVVSATGVYASYAGGHLPFDAEKDQIYEAGLRVSF